jgi:hypothetical protein
VLGRRSAEDKNRKAEFGRHEHGEGDHAHQGSSGDAALLRLGAARDVKVLNLKERVRCRGLVSVRWTAA